MLITLNSTANSAGAATFNPAGGTSASYYSTASPSNQSSTISKASSTIITLLVVLFIAFLAIGICRCFMSHFRHSKQPAQVIARQQSSISVRMSQSYPQLPVSDAISYCDSDKIDLLHCLPTAFCHVLKISTGFGHSKLHARATRGRVLVRRHAHC